MLSHKIHITRNLRLHSSTISAYMDSIHFFYKTAPLRPEQQYSGEKLLSTHFSKVERSFRRRTLFLRKKRSVLSPPASTKHTTHHTSRSHYKPTFSRWEGGIRRRHTREVQYFQQAEQQKAVYWDFIARTPIESSGSCIPIEALFKPFCAWTPPALHQ